jgi:hypothetical protein
MDLYWHRKCKLLASLALALFGLRWFAEIDFCNTLYARVHFPNIISSHVRRVHASGFIQQIPQAILEKSLLKWTDERAEIINNQALTTFYYTPNIH